MPKRKGLPRDHDFAVNARSVLEQVIGERLDGTPLEPAKPTNPKLTERARKGGVVGGPRQGLEAEPRASLRNRSQSSKRPMERVNAPLSEAFVVGKEITLRDLSQEEG